jgi:hypothetical protein
MWEYIKWAISFVVKISFDLLVYRLLGYDPQEDQDEGGEEQLSEPRETVMVSAELPTIPEEEKKNVDDSSDGVDTGDIGAPNHEKKGADSEKNRSNEAADDFTELTEDDDEPCNIKHDPNMTIISGGSDVSTVPSFWERLFRSRKVEAQTNDGPHHDAEGSLVDAPLTSHEVAPVLTGDTPENE